MTQVGVAGRGMGAQLAADLWDEMQANPACQRAAVVQRIEDLAPFVDRIGPDLISDLATRIAFGVLAEFTADMMRRYPQLAAGSTTADERVWDIPMTRWRKRAVTLPVADGRRLLLIPTSQVWMRQVITAPSFYQVQALGRIQDMLTRPPRRVGGLPIVPRKMDLRPAHPRIRPTNIEQAVAAADEGVSLTARHAVRLRHRLTSQQLTPEQVNRLL
jgi:hypothetical protein